MKESQERDLNTRLSRCRWKFSFSVDSYASLHPPQARFGSVTFICNPQVAACTFGTVKTVPYTCLARWSFVLRNQFIDHS